MTLYYLPRCPQCGCVAEATVKWEDEDVAALRHAGNIHDTVSVKVRIPVWTCNTCNFAWTDHHAENIRQKAIDQLIMELK